MLIIDAHVHIHAQFRLDRFFGSAHRNLSKAAASFQTAKDFTGVLMLTESRDADWFRVLASMEEGGRSDPRVAAGPWRISRTGDGVSLRVHDGERQAFFVIAGRQVVTAEKLEVLALFVGERIEDGRPVREVIGRVEALGGLPVLPWGFGKWSGRRGTVLDRLLAEDGRPMLCLGDNGGRPDFLPEPRQFRFAREAGIPVLPGSDPLPFATEEVRAGSFGCGIAAGVALGEPSGDLKKLLTAPGMVLKRYGRLETPLRFLRNQVKMQLWKRNWIAG
jgi:hypothetical protein